MKRRDRWLARGAAAFLVLAFSGVAPRAEAGSAAAMSGRAVGCHAWAPVFRPVLGILGAGRLLVALPAHVPHFGQRLYVHANVLNPPLTYDVALSSQPGHGWPVPVLSTVLMVHGSVGTSPPLKGWTKVVMGGKTLILPPKGNQTGALKLPARAASRSAYWEDHRANITYFVTLPARVGRAALLRTAASLTTGRLRRTPITAKPTRFNACP